MSEETTKAAELRGELRKFREKQRRGKYPMLLRARAIAYALERRREGTSVTEIASELGVADATANAWSSSGDEVSSIRHAQRKVGASSTVPLLPVVVRADATMKSRLTRLEVEYPDGTRLSASGLAAHEVVEAIESLRVTR